MLGVRVRADEMTDPIVGACIAGELLHPRCGPAITKCAAIKSCDGACELPLPQHVSTTGAVSTLTIGYEHPLLEIKEGCK